MGEKAFDIYQGGDWMTYRATVAQAFDTLDRMRELCANAPLSPSLKANLSLPTYEMLEDASNVFVAIVELCDDLVGELDAAEADLFPYLQSDPALRWSAFEIRLHMKEIRLTALNEHEAPEPSHVPLDTVAALVSRMRDLLKHIDQ